MYELTVDGVTYTAHTYESAERMLEKMGGIGDIRVRRLKITSLFDVTTMIGHLSSLKVID